MAKRKQNQFPINTDSIRWGIILVLGLAALVIAWLALSSYVRHSGLFVVKDIIVAESLLELNIPDLERLKGQNVFEVNLDKVQSRIRARYPQVADLKVMRRLPDEIVVSGEQRVAFVVAVFDGKRSIVSRDGYIIGGQGKADDALVLIKGLSKQKPVSGLRVEDPDLEGFFQAVDQVKKDKVLEPLHLIALDVSDASKIIFTFGLSEDTARFDVVVDKAKCADKLKVFSVMMSRTDLAIDDVKYIDLRFDSPVIGKKKVKK